MEKRKEAQRRRREEVRGEASVKRDVTSAVQSFFIYGFLPTGLNATILALVPKKTDAREMKDYRPISCCNVLYKAISKIIANRLKTLLPQFIAPNQSAFIKDRLLMKNLLLATELVKDYHKEDISARCAMKIDISKAFDSVQWPFLLNILSALNLPERFIHWIKLCITTASFSVKVNGELAGFFKSEKGLRQGCSLSPILFVICMNVLSAMLDKAAAEQRVGYHPRCENQQLTHLCFADDIMVFTDGKMLSMEGILGVFNNFAAISGLHISLEKSTLFLAGIPSSQQTEILSRFPFDSGVLPVRYLGLPLLTKRMSLTDCLPLLEKIRSRISSWKHRFLSFAGRLQLLSSVIASLTNFWISAFRLPSACIQEIEKICSAFLWSGPELNTRKAKYAWSDICRPKKEGGLGLKSIREVNKVSCFKLIWRLTSGQNSLWVNWIQRQLIRTGSFWSINESTSAGSWMWKKLLKYRTQARHFHKMEVNSGTQTSFWYDHWCPLGQLYDITGSRGFIDLGFPSDTKLDQALSSRRRRRHRNALYNSVEIELDKIRAKGPSTELDSGLWRQSTGQFKRKFLASDTWQQTRRTSATAPWHKCVWFSDSIPKHSFLLWLAAHNRLTTGERMLSWNKGICSSCVFCQTTVETRDHLFFLCPFSSQIWAVLTRKLFQHHYANTFRDITQLLSGSMFTGTVCYVLRLAFQATVHSIWLERNRRRHGEQPKPVDQLDNSSSSLMPRSETRSPPSSGSTHKSLRMGSVSGLDQDHK